MSTETQVLIVVALAALAFLVVAVLASRNSRSKKQRLRERFGPEYDRALEQLGDERRAEHELAARERRVQKLHVNELDGAHRVQFASDWAHAQTRFVDDPAAAVREADELIQSVMRARGYPVEDFERRVEDLSVDHANVVDHYRAARALVEASREGRANTEALRQALVHYRALFADLLEEPRVDRQAHENVRQEARGAH